MITISYKEEENLIQIKREGDIYAQDLIELIQRVDQDFKDSEKLYIVDDTGQSVSKFNHQDDYIQISTEIEKITSNFDHVYHAIVAETPANAALSSIYEMYASRIPNYTFNFFSSSEAAVQWLSLL